jgi:hypothetical protein
MIHKASHMYAIWINRRRPFAAGGAVMSSFGWVAMLVAFGVMAGLGAWWRRAVRRARVEALAPGALVRVRTPDGCRLLARVVSRGPSHFWIELPPGDARWWVPATAVEPAGRNAPRDAVPFKRPASRVPRWGER